MWLGVCGWQQIEERSEKIEKKIDTNGGKSPIIIYILPPLPYNPIKQNNERKTKTKNQPLPGNLPSSSVPKPAEAKEVAFHPHGLLEDGPQLGLPRPEYS